MPALSRAQNCAAPAAHSRIYSFGRVGAGAGPFKLFLQHPAADAVCISLPPKKDWYGD